MNTRESMLRSKEVSVQVACAHCRTSGRLWERMWVLMAGAMAIMAVGAAAEKAAVEPAPAAPTASAPQPAPRTSLPTPPPEPRTRSGEFPPPEPVSDPSPLGRGIQRTMTLLATSTAQHRNHVRVVFYGQSITEQEWSKQVADDLRRRFPHADLEIENRAIGGFASQMLIRPAEHDLYPFYPDLVIFHVFGANQQYDQIIQSIRSRTTAEVLMQTDRVGAKWPQDQPDKEADKGLWWDYLLPHHAPAAGALVALVPQPGGPRRAAGAGGLDAAGEPCLGRRQDLGVRRARLGHGAGRLRPQRPAVCQSVAPGEDRPGRMVPRFLPAAARRLHDSVAGSADVRRHIPDAQARRPDQRELDDRRPRPYQPKAHPGDHRR